MLTFQFCVCDKNGGIRRAWLPQFIETSRANVGSTYIEFRNLKAYCCGYQLRLLLGTNMGGLKTYIDINLTKTYHIYKKNMKHRHLVSWPSGKSGVNVATWDIRK